MRCDGIVGRRILVVEDDYLLAVDLAALLHRAGAEVLGPVGTVEEAMAALDLEPDVVTLDVELGNAISHAVADELARRGVPFIFATGSAASIPSHHTARTICHKPLADHVILEALADALA